MEEVRKVELNFNFAEKVWRVGTRDAELALQKTEAALAYCKQRDPKFQYRLVTAGELREEREWSFEVRVSAASMSMEARLRSDLKMLEEAAQAKVIDFFVEDLARLPLRISEHLRLAAVLPRRDVRDVLILPKGKRFSTIEYGANIGAYGERRAFLLAQLRKDLLVQQTQDSLAQGMERVLHDDYSGYITTAMDLQFTDISPYTEELSFFPFAVKAFCPAPGQGLLGLLTAAENVKGAEQLKEMADDEKAHAAYLCETRVTRKLLGVQVDAHRQAAAHLYYDESNTAYLRAVNTLSDVTSPKQVDMPLAFHGKDQINKDLEQAAFKALLGKISIVGAGPGPAELLTVRALELLKTADVIAFDDISTGSVLSRASAQAEQLFLDFNIVNGKSILPPGEKVSRILMDKARQGKDVVRLCSGDPWLMDPAAAESVRLAKAKMAFELVPGVSAALAAASYAAVPSTLIGKSNSVHMLDGRDPFADAEHGFKDFRSLVRLGGTYIFSMVIQNLPEICNGLMMGGLNPNQDCILISDAGLATQRVLRAPLAEIASRAVKENFLPPATFVVGPTIAFSEQLRWWPPHGILSGKMIVIGKSRANDSYAQALKQGAESRGARAIELALVEHHTTEAVAKRMDRDFLKLMENHNKLRRPERSKQWFVFTSGIAVEALHRCLTRLQFDIRKMAHIKIAAYGNGTLAALREIGYTPDFVPEIADMEHLASGIAERVTKEDMVIQVRGTMAVPVLSVVMQLRGIPFAELIAYETYNHLPGREALLQLLDDINYFVFTSPTAVYSFFESLKTANILPQQLNRLRITLVPALQACTNALQSRGFAKERFPEEYTELGVLNFLTDLSGEESDGDGETGL